MSESEERTFTKREKGLIDQIACDAFWAFHPVYGWDGEMDPEWDLLKLWEDLPAAEKERYLDFGRCLFEGFDQGMFTYELIDNKELDKLAVNLAYILHMSGHFKEFAKGCDRMRRQLPDWMQPNGI